MTDYMTGDKTLTQKIMLNSELMEQLNKGICWAFNFYQKKQQESDSPSSITDNSRESFNFSEMNSYVKLIKQNSNGEETTLDLKEKAGAMALEKMKGKIKLCVLLPPDFSRSILSDSLNKKFGCETKPEDFERKTSNYATHLRYGVEIEYDAVEISLDKILPKTKLLGINTAR